MLKYSLISLKIKDTFKCRIYTRHTEHYFIIRHGRLKVERSESLSERRIFRRIKLRLTRNFFCDALSKLIRNNEINQRDMHERPLVHFTLEKSWEFSGGKESRSRVTESFFQFRLVFPRRRCLIKCFPPRDGSTVSEYIDHWGKPENYSSGAPVIFLISYRLPRWVVPLDSYEFHSTTMSIPQTDFNPSNVAIWIFHFSFSISNVFFAILQISIRMASQTILASW